VLGILAGGASGYRVNVPRSTDRDSHVLEDCARAYKCTVKERERAKRPPKLRISKRRLPAHGNARVSKGVTTVQAFPISSNGWLLSLLFFTDKQTHNEARGTVASLGLLSGTPGIWRETPSMFKPVFLTEELAGDDFVIGCWRCECVIVIPLQVDIDMVVCSVTESQRWSLPGQSDESILSRFVANFSFIPLTLYQTQ
jgi:hypothetical protein